MKQYDLKYFAHNSQGTARYRVKSSDADSYLSILHELKHAIEEEINKKEEHGTD